MAAKEPVRFNRLVFHDIESLPDTLCFCRLDTEFGQLVMAAYREGICFIGFELEESERSVLQDIGRRWPGVSLHEDSSLVGLLSPPDAILTVWLYGTPFQKRVWRALAEIPAGTTCSYGELAQRIGEPKAVRAVASAVGANPVSWILPCHRVIRQGGEIGQYHWGVALKRAILISEQGLAADTTTLCF